MASVTSSIWDRLFKVPSYSSVLAQPARTTMSETSTLGMSSAAIGSAPVPMPQPQLARNPRSMLGVYDASTGGIDLTYPLDFQGTGYSFQNITFSTATFGRIADDEYTTGTGLEGFIPLPNDPGRFFSSSDAGYIINEGNNNQFSENFSFRPNISGVLTQMRLNFAMALNVSSYTSGNFSLDGVGVTVNSYQNSTQPVPFSSNGQIELLPEVDFTPLTATGTQIIIVRTVLNGSVQLVPGQPLTVELTLDTTLGTGNSQAGLLPFFPLYATTANKFNYESSLQLHILPTPANIDTIRPFMGEYSIAGTNQPAGVH